jgi:hypothetical protein
MGKLQIEAQQHCMREGELRAHAAQTAAMFLITGLDLDAACAAGGPERSKIICRLERLLERERLKGGQKHWSYDLGRHVALKQALDKLRLAVPQQESSA